jgi:hypothetical protein
MDWVDYLRDQAAKYRQLAETAEDPQGGGVVVEESLIKVLYRFHQTNNVSISEVAHTSLPVPPVTSVQPGVEIWHFNHTGLNLSSGRFLRWR